MLAKHLQDMHELLSAFMIIGVIAASINGSLRAIRAKMDMTGAILLSFFAANGGGTVRDLLLGTTVFWINDQFYIWLTLSIGVISFLFLSYKRSVLSSRLLYRFLLVTDAMGLAAFSLAGVEKAISLSQNATIAIMMGIWTAVGGGILADIVSNEIPVVLSKEIYITIAFIGSIFYLILCHITNGILAGMISATFMILFRLYSVKFNLSFPSI